MVCWIFGFESSINRSSSYVSTTRTKDCRKNFVEIYSEAQAEYEDEGIPSNPSPSRTPPRAETVGGADGWL